MKRKLISYLLALCMAAGLIALPAGPVRAEQVETILAELRYDAATRTEIQKNVDLSDSTAAYDAETEGWKFMVKGKDAGGDGSTKAFAAVMSAEQGGSVSGMTVTYEVVMTLKDAGTNRNFQVFYNGSKNKSILKTNPSGTCYLLGIDDSDDYRFSPQNGHKYRFTYTFDLAVQKVTASAADLTDGGTEVKRTPETETGFDNIVKFKHEFSPKQADGEKYTYLHSVKAYTVSDNSVEIDQEVMSVLPPCAGDPISVPVKVTGAVPDRVELLVNGAVTAEADAPPFALAVPRAEAGTCRLRLRAYYGGMSLDSEELTIEVPMQKRTAVYRNDFNDSDLKNAGRNGRTDFVQRNGGEAGDLAFEMTSYTENGNKNASHFAYSFSPALTPENTGKFEIALDMIPGEKGTQRGLEIKFLDGETTAEDLILFRFKADGSWAFAGGSKNAQYKPGSTYHIEMVIDQIDNSYDCLLLEDGKLLYKDRGLTLATKSGAAGKPISRLKIQQNGEEDGASCQIDNVGICRYEEIKEVTITETHAMASPDGRVTGSFLLDSEGSVWYSAAYDGKPVLEQAALGLELDAAGGGPLSSGFTLEREEPVTVTGSWTPLYGTKAEYPENYTQYTYRMTENGSGRQLHILFRLYNEGMAFRYVIPEQAGLDSGYAILAEQTEFRPAGDPEVWYQTKTETIPYHKKLSAMGNPTGIRRPMTLLFEDGTGAAIVESDMYGFARMHMDKTGGNTFRSALAGSVSVKAAAAAQSPWRAVILGTSSGDVLEKGYLVENLAPEPSGPEYEDVSWITPGKAVRVANGFSYENAVKHVDFAVDRNMQYIMFDGGWYGDEGSGESDPRYPTNDAVTGKPMDMKAICGYAHAKGIKVVVYINNRAIFEEYLYNSKNGRPAPRYTTEELLRYLSEWGIDGLKPGFVDCDTQQAEIWNLDLARTAAKYHMTVNTHDLYVPAGTNRTYPNFVGAEGIWGDEHPDITAARDLTHFFTRYVQGPADHTWCWYNYRVSKTFRLASAVLSYSPQQYQFWYEGPQNYTKADEKELQFWKDVPAVWDDTRVLEGEIGKYLTIARRSGTDWFLGSGSAVNRELSIPLDFLGSGQYIAEIYRNGPDDYFDITVADPNDPVSAKTVNGKRDTVITEKKLVSQSDTLTCSMKDSFGYAVRFKPATPEEIAKLSYVEIISPISGSSMEPQDITFQVSVGEGVQKVEYYSDSRLIGTADTAPFAFTWPNPGEGMYSVTARAYYAGGAVAETEEPTVVGLASMSEAAVLDLNFNDGSYTGVDISTDTKQIVPKRETEKEDLAVKITTVPDGGDNARAHQLNYVPNPALTASTGKRIRLQADFLFQDNQTRRGLFELRRVAASGQQDNPILVNLDGGNISVKGAAASVPYRADAVYRIKIVLDMQTWRFDCTITEEGKTIFQEAGLSMGSADFTKLERVKCQQEIAAKGLAESVMFVDNYQVYRSVAAPEVNGYTFTDASGGTSADAAAAPLETREIRLTFTSDMKAASLKENVRMVRMTDGAPVAFEGVCSGTDYTLTLGSALDPDTAYRIYFDGAEDKNGVPVIKGYFARFRTEKQPFGLDSFLCMAGDGYVSSVSQISAGQEVRVMPAVRNETQETRNFTVVVCVHSADGALRGGAAERYSLGPGQTLHNAAISFTAYAGISAADTLEVYVWDGLRTMRPLSLPRSF